MSSIHYPPLDNISQKAPPKYRVLSCTIEWSVYALRSSGSGSRSSLDPIDRPPPEGALRRSARSRGSHQHVPATAARWAEPAKLLQPSSRRGKAEVGPHVRVAHEGDLDDVLPHVLRGRPCGGERQNSSDEFSVINLFQVFLSLLKDVLDTFFCI